jgi:hypothetical protein
MQEFNNDDELFEEFSEDDLYDLNSEGVVSIPLQGADGSLSEELDIPLSGGHFIKDSESINFMTKEGKFILMEKPTGAKVCPHCNKTPYDPIRIDSIDSPSEPTPSNKECPHTLDKPTITSGTLFNFGLMTVLETVNSIYHMSMEQTTDSTLMTEGYILALDPENTELHISFNTSLEDPQIVATVVQVIMNYCDKLAWKLKIDNSFKFKESED